MIKIARATILDIQPEMEIYSPPGHFYHEPPLHILVFQGFEHWKTSCLNWAHVLLDNITLQNG